MTTRTGTSRRTRLVLAAPIALGLALFVAGLVLLGSTFVETSRYSALGRDSLAAGEAGGGTALSAVRDGTSDTQASQETTDATAGRDWSMLEDQNPSTAAWIQVDGTGVDYPVLQASPEDPDRWLRHDFWGSLAVAGCPYIDSRCSVSSPNCVIYSHNMGYGHADFTDLANACDPGSFDTIGDCTLETPSATVRLTPLCSVRVAEDDPTIQEFGLSTPADLHQWLSALCSDATARSSGWEELVSSSHRAVVLVTCSYVAQVVTERTCTVFVA